MANWAKIRRAYVSGAESYRDLAARVGVSVSSLSKVATKEGWAKKRKKYRDKLDTETEAALRARACAREVSRIERLEKAADRMAERLEALMADEQQFFRYVTMQGEEGVGKKADMKAVRNFTSALQTMVKMTQEMRGPEDDTGAGVVMIPPVLAETVPAEQGKAAREPGEAGQESGGAGKGKKARGGAGK